MRSRSLRRLLLRVLAVFGVVLLVASCGGEERSRIDAAVDDARQAIDDGDRAAAERALDAIALEALAARNAGTLDDDEVAQIADLVESSKTLLDDVVPPSTTTSSSTTETTEPAPDIGPLPDRAEGEGQGNGSEGRDDKDDDDKNEDDKDDKDDDD